MLVCTTSLTLDTSPPPACVQLQEAEAADPRHRPFLTQLQLRIARLLIKMKQPEKAVEAARKVSELPCPAAAAATN